jgi:hypothetical protein
MKALVKILLILFCVSTNISCSKNVANTKKIEKLLLWETVCDGFAFVDGIKITDGKTSDSFLLSIDMPECCQSGEAKIQIQHKTFILDSLFSENKEIINIENEFYPSYVNNTLSITFLNEKPILTFVTSLENKSGGLDPITIILWVYYENKVYRFSGVVPTHQDWEWNETYKFQPDDNLGKKSKNVYYYVVDSWNNYLAKYKIWYQQ